MSSSCSFWPRWDGQDIAPRIDSFHDLVWDFGNKSRFGELPWPMFLGIYNLHPFTSIYIHLHQFTSIYINLHQFTMMQWHLPIPSTRFCPRSISPFQKHPLVVPPGCAAVPTPDPKGFRASCSASAEKTVLRSRMSRDVKGNKAFHLDVSENVVYPEKPNGFADHYPYEKWL